MPDALAPVRKRSLPELTCRSPPFPKSSPSSRPGAWSCSSTRRTARTKATSSSPRDFVTPETINFMAKHARGLVCLTLEEDRCRRLGLAPDGGRQPLGARHQLHRVDRSGRRRDHGHLRGRSRAHRAGRGGAGRAARRHRAAGPHLSRDGAARRRARARRPHRSRLRPRAPRRPHAGGGDLRDHARRRRDGAHAGPRGVRAAARVAASARSPTSSTTAAAPSAWSSASPSVRSTRRTARSASSCTATRSPTRRISRWCAARSRPTSKRSCACTSRCR